MIAGPAPSARAVGVAVIGKGAMVLAGLALTAAIQPDRWVAIGGSAGSHAEYLDMESLERSDAKVSFWTRRDYAGGQGSAWHEIELDCGARTETILAYVRDDGRSVSHNVVRPHRQAAPIAPGSLAERVFAIACR